MANESTTGFGCRPIRTVGQTDDNSGLGEFQVAASSTAIYHHDPVLTATSGYITVSAASSGANYAGVLNGSFYVDPTTSKPTWSNYAPSVAAEQNVLLISNPQAMYEVRTASSTPGRTSIGGTADIVYTAGAAPNYVSRVTMSGTVTTTITLPIKVMGISRDPLNQDTSAAGCVYRVLLNANIWGNNVAGI